MNQEIFIEEIKEAREEISSIIFKKLLERSGLFLFVSGILLPMGIITGEMLYPKDRGYTTGGNRISDLSGTVSSGGFMPQPSAAILDTAMVLSGIMIIMSAYYLDRATGRRIISASLALLGMGILGAGIFPGNIPVLHPIFLLITFLFGAISAIASSYAVDAPLKYVFIILGSVSLFFLLFFRVLTPILGAGGTERWVMYPIIFWMLGFGAYILGKNARSMKEKLGTTIR